MSSSIPKTKLSSGFEIPLLGLGTWNDLKRGEVQNAVYLAIESGYRHFDCAYLYENEDEVGAAIQAASSKGIVKRDDLFITSKCWNTFHRYEKVLECCKISLSKLKLDYIDLYLIHWPMGYKEGASSTLFDSSNDSIFNDIDYLETWKGMEECVRLGLTRSIGLSNFNQKQIQRVLDNCTIQPVVLQIESHPYLTQAKLIEYCSSKNIKVTAYSPLGSSYKILGKPTLLQEPRLASIAKEHNKTVAQVLIRFQIQRGIIVIPKSANKNRIMENMNVFDFQLSESNMKELLNLGVSCRYFTLSPDTRHPHYPFHD